MQGQGREKKAPAVRSTDFSMSATRKRLSCDRCHAQKLRCARDSSADEESCGRCRRHGTKCVYSVALPKGRPRSKPESSLAHGTPTRHSTRAHSNHATTRNRTRNNMKPKRGPCLADTVGPSPDALQRSPTVLDDSPLTLHPFSSGAKDYLRAFDMPVPTNLDFLDFSPIPSMSWNDVAGPTQGLAATPSAGPFQTATSVLQGYIEPIQPLARNLESPEVDSAQCSNERDQQPLGYSSPDFGPQIRPSPYVEKSFWGCIQNQESLYIPSTEDSNISTAKTIQTTTYAGQEAYLLDLVKEIPSKTICDNFMQSFISSIYPLYPLVDLPTLRRDYGTLWSILAQKPQNWKSNNPFADPTVLTVLFAALYCGARAVPTNVWSQSPALRGTDMLTLIDGLRTVCNKALDRIYHSRDATLNTLTASLLHHFFEGPDNTATQAQSFVSIAVRTAQQMGLHREFTIQGLSHTMQELRRRIWWHVVWLDVRCSLRYGSQMHCGAEGDQWDVQGLGDPALEAEEEALPSVAQFSSVPNFHEHLLPLRFTVGTAEVAGFLHGLLHRVNSCREFGQADLDVYLKRYKKLHTKLADIISALGAPDIHDQGQSLVWNHETLRNSGEQPAAFIPWAKTALIALVKGSLMVLQKAFLGYTSLTVQQSQMLWMSTFRLSIDVLIHIHGTVQLAGSWTQLWFLKTSITPLALTATSIILNHIKVQPTAEQFPEALEIVDRTFNLFSLANRFPSVRPLGTLSCPANAGEQQGDEWQLLRALRAQIAAPASRPTSETCDSVQSYEEQGKMLMTLGLSPDSTVSVPRSFSQNPQSVFLGPSEVPDEQSKEVTPSLNSMIQDIECTVPRLGVAAYRAFAETQVDEGWPAIELPHRDIYSNRAACFSNPEIMQQNVSWC